MLKIKLLVLALLLAGTTTAYAITNQPEPVEQIETRTETEQPKEVEEVKEPEAVEPEPVTPQPTVTPEPIVNPEPTPEPTPEPEVVKPTVEELKAYATPKIRSIPNLIDSKPYAVMCFNDIAERQFNWNLTYAEVDTMVAIMTESKTPCGHRYVLMNTGDYIYRGEQ